MEMEQVISQLERGTAVTRFFPRKRPEKKTLMVRRETRQVVWARQHTNKSYDGASMRFNDFQLHLNMFFFNYHNFVVF